MLNKKYNIGPFPLNNDSMHTVISLMTTPILIPFKSLPIELTNRLPPLCCLIDTIN